MHASQKQIYVFADIDDVNTSSLDPHNMLCLHWPGSMVKLKATSDRPDLEGRLGKIAGADHFGRYQVLVVPPDQRVRPKTVYMPRECVEFLPDDHLQKTKGYSPSCFAGPSKLLRFEVGDQVWAKMEQGWKLGQIISIWNPDRSIYHVAIRTNEGAFRTAIVPCDTRQYVRYATRFQIGDRVRCRNIFGGWLNGRVTDFALERDRTRLLYTVTLDHNNTMMYPLLDNDIWIQVVCKRSGPRFKVGDRVQAFMGAELGWMDGTVRQLGSPQESWVYSISLDDKDRCDTAHAPSDDDQIVRKLKDFHSLVRMIEIGVTRKYFFIQLSVKC